MDPDYELKSKFCTKHVFRTLRITNRVTAKIFDVNFNNFCVEGIRTSGHNVQKYATKLYNYGHNYSSCLPVYVDESFHTNAGDVSPFLRFLY
jgi:hypothetical protein